MMKPPARPRDASRVAMLEDNASGRRNRGGRPPSQNPRRHQVMVRLTADERARLEELAGPGGIAEYLRATGLRHQPRIPRVVPQVNRDAWIALAPLLANLNQLTRHVNANGTLGDALLLVLEDVRREILDLRAAMLGSEDAKPPL